MSENMSKYDDLVRKLKEIFQIDRPELDFGVYRILNARVGEINDYLENGLKAKVAESLSASGAGNLKALQKELKDKETQYRADGMDPDTVPKVKELRQKIADLGSGGAEHENAVFTHLLTFFSRYYDKGDFISQRRYKGDTYAIPYAGEEVVLHWANKDQYYTKSGENFSNYGFKLDDGRSVKFRLVAADTAKDNRKDNDKERLFVLIDRHTRTLLDENGDEYEQEYLPIEEVGNELVIRFDYKAMPKGSKQDVLVSKAVDAILADPAVQARWLDLSRREATEKNPQRTLLEKCLTSYTTKNSADYFIHKDLGGFLRRELDFYIKNEVMHLDDVQSAEKFSDIEKLLRLIQTLRSIALDLITFLSQLEDFQKRLWLKKKFAVSTNYCITLDRLSEKLYPEIASNFKQWDQWKDLGMLGSTKHDLLNDGVEKNIEFLKSNQFLMVDTTLFPAAFKHRVLADIANLDEWINGLLIHGDNFQSLNFMQERYKGQVNSIYIDPPYNTDATVIEYKNGYRESSWLSLMNSRLPLGKSLLRDDGVHVLTIDDYEHAPVRQLLDATFGSENYLATVAIRNNPSGRSTVKGFSVNHEFALFHGVKAEKTNVGRLPHSDEQRSRYDLIDEVGAYEWENFRKSSAGSDRASRPKQFFPIYVKTDDMSIRIPQLLWVDAKSSYEINEECREDESIVWPIDVDGNEKVWRWGLERTSKEIKTILVKSIKDGIRFEVYGRKYLNDAGLLPRTWWDKSEYSARDNGTRLLRDMFSVSVPFDFPKALHAVVDSVKIGCPDSDGLVLDYFGGSGTTGHAVISLNRSNKENRKFILIEQGEYFESVTKARIQKVVYSSEWKDGKATSLQTGSSHAFKVIKIESYEDTLNNLYLTRSQAQQNLLESMPSEAKEDYLLRYMLDVESRGSLLSVDKFKKPFDCKLKVSVDSAGAYEERTIDLVETFNYLIGLRVKHVDMQIDRGFAAVTGVLPSGEKALVLWRDVEKLSYDELNRLCDKLAINPADSEFDVVYINGDHNIPAVFTSTEAEGGITKTLKIRQIEPEFMSRMFNTEA